MPQNLQNSRPEIEVILDGLPVGLPSEHQSLAAIRCHLEMLALEKQRVLYSLVVDGHAANVALPLQGPGNFSRVEAGTVPLEETSLLVLKKAFQQTDYARECVETALTLVLINNDRVANEVWWNLAMVLKEPVLTLSLFAVLTKTGMLSGVGYSGFATCDQVRPGVETSLVIDLS